MSSLESAAVMSKQKVGQIIIPAAKRIRDIMCVKKAC
jgi:hypothetical protein